MSHDWQLPKRISGCSLHGTYYCLPPSPPGLGTEVILFQWFTGRGIAVSSSYQRSGISSERTDERHIEAKKQETVDQDESGSIVRFSGKSICKLAWRNSGLIFNDFGRASGFRALDKRFCSWFETAVRQPWLIAVVSPRLGSRCDSTSRTRCHPEESPAADAVEGSAAASDFRPSGLLPNRPPHNRRPRNSDARSSHLGWVDEVFSHSRAGHLVHLNSEPAIQTPG